MRPETLDEFYFARRIAWKIRSCLKWHAEFSSTGGTSALLKTGLFDRYQ